MQRHNLSWVEPGHTEPADGEEGVEDEEECDRDPAEGDIYARGDTRKNSHGTRLSDGSEEHELATTESLNCPDGYEGGEEVFCSVECGEEASEVGAQTNVLVDLCCVVCASSVRIAL